MKTIRLLFIVSLPLIMASCAVGPDYHMPDNALPSHWFSTIVQDKASSEKLSVEKEWWKHFNDPVLDQLIAKAGEGNFDLKIAQARIAQARAGVKAARMALLPTGNVGGTAERQANRIAFPGPIDLSKPFNTFQTGFDASWEIDIFGGQKRAEENQQATLAAAEATRDDVTVSLMAEVARSYIDIRQYQKQLAITDDTIGSSQDTLKIAKERFASGDAAGLEVVQAQAQLDSQQTQRPYYENMLAQSEFSMDVLLGEQPGATQTLVEKTAGIPVSDKELILAAPADIIAQRPDIRVADRQLAAATAQQGVAVSQFFPKISLSGFLGLLNVDASDLAQGGSRSWSGTGNVILPILNYGTLSANLDATNARQQEAMANYQKVVIAALSDVERSVTAYSKQEEFRQSLTGTVSQNAHAADVARQRYHEGLSSFLEVLDAQRVLYGSQSQLASAQALASQDLVSAYKSLGGGWNEAPVVAPDDQSPPQDKDGDQE